eukprot:4713981-Pyramimonas_sp.AAC.1
MLFDSLAGSAISSSIRSASIHRRRPGPARARCGDPITRARLLATSSVSHPIWSRDPIRH